MALMQLATMIEFLDYDLAQRKEAARKQQEEWRRQTEERRLYLAEYVQKHIADWHSIDVPLSAIAVSVQDTDRQPADCFRVSILIQRDRYNNIVQPRGPFIWDANRSEWLVDDQTGWDHVVWYSDMSHTTHESFLDALSSCFRL